MNWTDDKVKEFVRVYTIGKYWDDYRDCYTMDEKFRRFKLINKGDQMDKYANPIEKLTMYLNWVNGITFSRDVYQKEPDNYTSDKFEQMQSNLLLWLSNLDGGNKKRVMELAEEYHKDEEKVVKRSHRYMEDELKREDCPF